MLNLPVGLDLKYQPYKYTDYNSCNIAHDSDMYNHFINMCPDSKYYSGDSRNSSNTKKASTIYFMHLNARSLNSNFKEIEEYISSLN